MASFEIVELDSAGKPRPFPAGIFPDGKTASSIIATLSARYPDKKFQPRPIKDVTGDWKAREQQRFTDEVYKPLDIGLTPIKEHFAFKSLKVPANVGYTASPADGIIDKQTSIHIRVYLQRFYPQLSVEESRKIVWDYCGEDVSEGLCFARTQEEIVHVYTHGPGSCMSDDDYGDDHPVKAYATEDFAVAYIKNENGRITARSVVYMPKKIFYNGYGDIQKLFSALKTNGYTHNNDRSAYHGARLLKITAPTKTWDDYNDCWDHDGGEGYLCPYLDLGSAVKVEGDFLVVCDCYDNNALDCHNTSGVTEF